MPGVRVIKALLVVAVIVDVAYWALWFGARSWVAGEDRAAYVEFENAFPAADALLAVLCVLAWFALDRRSPLALLWLIAAGGAGLYLFCMDVLYDVQHGIYLLGAGGVIEALINVITLVLSVSALRWAWTRRSELLTA
jgi:hypothetical protein